MNRAEAINYLIGESIKEGNFDTNDIRDGYHSFGELYEHRITLFIALCKAMRSDITEGQIWRSKLHSDGTSFPGWFILGIWEAEGDQITYHLPISKWDETNFAIELDKAPPYDGHTPEDVLTRLKNL
jgi:hypothetical protein